MNQKQRVALLIGAALFILAGLFPPWTEIVRYASLYQEKDGGYSAVWVPPKGPTYYCSYHINFSRLLVEWAVLVVATGASLIWLSKATDGRGKTRPMQEGGPEDSRGRDQFHTTQEKSSATPFQALGDGGDLKKIDIPSPDDADEGSVDILPNGKRVIRPGKDSDIMSGMMALAILHFETLSQEEREVVASWVGSGIPRDILAKHFALAMAHWIEESETAGEPLPKSISMQAKWIRARTLPPLPKPLTPAMRDLMRRHYGDLSPLMEMESTKRVLEIVAKLREKGVDIKQFDVKRGTGCTSVLLLALSLALIIWAFC